MTKRAFFNWSSGKDSAMALQLALADTEFVVDQLVTTVSKATQRVSMHGVRIDLLQRQARQLGLPLKIVSLPEDTDMVGYNTIMETLTSDLKAQGYTHGIFGDILLEDLRKYREERYAQVGLKAHFPLWKKDTKEVVLDFIRSGYKAVCVSANARYLGKEMVGRLIDEEFIETLPKEVDPSGENGEFHSFVYDGPLFKAPVDFKLGEKVLKTYPAPQVDKDDCFSATPSWDTSFWFCDLL